jgi:adenylate cyclase class 2
MARNIEVKLRLADPARVRAAAVAAGARSAGVETQVDRYYALDGGRRVKLRTRDRGVAELIRYDRPEVAGVRVSDYTVTPAGPACRVPAGPPIAVVRKRREVLLLENVRIHLDEVERLGAFLEIEAVVDARHDDAACRRQVDALLARLGLADVVPIPSSYGELIREKGSPRASAPGEEAPAGED